MIDLLAFLNDTVFDALPFAILCLGFLLTAKYLRMPDLTACGSVVFGAAVASISIVKWGWNPVPATILAAIAGAAAGALTGFFLTVLNIDKLLSGILASFVLFAVNLMLLTPTIAYGDSTLLSWLEQRDRLILADGGSWHPYAIAGFGVAVVCLKFGLDWFLDSETGLALRAIEDEEAGELALERQGLSPRRFKFLALCLGNAIVAFGGAMVSYKDGAANAGRGFDVLITGLVALLLGTEMLVAVRWLVRRSLPGRHLQLRETTGAIVGALTFFGMMTLSRRLGISSELTQIILVCAVALAAARSGSGIRALFIRRPAEARNQDAATLRVQGLSYRYPNADQYAVHNLSFALSDGEIVELAGGNGTGKTTALRLIAGFLPSMIGQIFYRGKNVTDSRTSRLQGMIYVDQNSQRGVVGSITVAENLALAAMDGQPSMMRRALRKQSAERIEKIMERAGFRASLMYQPACLLSGGQRQVLNLLTLLAKRKQPEVVLLDEPTNNLDVTNAARCGEILENLHRLGTAIVYVSHTRVPGIQPDRTIQLEEPRHDEVMPLSGGRGASK